MSTRNVGGGGLAERLITLLMGGIMGGFGFVAAWYCYHWAMDPMFVEHRHLWVAGLGVLAFFMLRGAWFTVRPVKEEKVIELTSGGR
ncbi:MAG: hypothetical protein AAGI12_03500 [Pseudomonadota bacterium]